MKAPTPLLLSADIRAAEARHADAQPPLMERAGSAIAALAIDLLGNRTGPVLVVVGPGNNGGDGLVAARLLAAQGREVTVVRAHSEDIPTGHWPLAIDALFGIGLTRPVTGRYADAIAALNQMQGPVLAVDIPSGLCADTGRVLGCAVQATHTLTFLAGKPGLYTLDGPDHCGHIEIDTLGVDIHAAQGWTISPSHFLDHLHPRRRNTHKGSFGDVAIVGGAPGMAGAALLAGRAALHLGAGRVYLGMLDRLMVDARQPELMLCPAATVFGLDAMLAIGPGLGQSDAALALLRSAIDSALPLVADADALNLLAAHPVLAEKVSRRGTAFVMTPHPAEAARLLGISVPEVQADRLAAATRLARQFQSVVVLKGCGSIVATPNGAWYINTTGNPGLATAGSGDVLTGMIAALLAQGVPALPAALAAVYLHGAAADALVAEGSGPTGLTASELIPVARRLLNQHILHA